MRKDSRLMLQLSIGLANHKAWMRSRESANVVHNPPPCICLRNTSTAAAMATPSCALLPSLLNMENPMSVGSGCPSPLSCTCSFSRCPSTAAASTSPRTASCWSKKALNTARVQPPPRTLAATGTAGDSGSGLDGRNISGGMSESQRAGMHLVIDRFDIDCLPVDTLWPVGHPKARADRPMGR